ncbi:hypothetical protein WK26_20775 [Burkholderia vietnamiensis]|uniref:hypothetical protein n=2 Tax=Burkholderiaceae TaxID=119060 RepID=UPI000552B562|nr:hypothetical protein [Burkholderia vietnamiensis]KVR78049.1 hypothetical protein WK26_20775 [Burkholderia vietnamiensis]KVS37044.1 hypothetical protein WK35_02365 [Burkholderia vietnamiensis]
MALLWTAVLSLAAKAFATSCAPRGGWPMRNVYADVIRLAQWVRAEADSITHMMAGYMLMYAHPDQHEKNPEAVKKAVTEIFHRIHVQE